MNPITIRYNGTTDNGGVKITATVNRKNGLSEYSKTLTDEDSEMEITEEECGIIN